MKLFEDKVTVYPPHAISKADIPIILSSIPEDWRSEIKTVRLSAAQGENPRVVAVFYPLDGSLTIKSRGISKERTLRAILTELAGHALGIKFLDYRRLQKRDESRIRKAIVPLLEEILPQLSRRKVWLDR